MRTVQNQLRQQVNRMHLENNKLSSEVTRLQTQTGRYAFLYISWMLVVGSCRLHSCLIVLQLFHFYALERLAQEERKLEEIVQEQGVTVAAFVDLVEENSTTLKELKVRFCDYLNHSVGRTHTGTH